MNQEPKNHDLVGYVRKDICQTFLLTIHPAISLITLLNYTLLFDEWLLMMTPSPGKSSSSCNLSPSAPFYLHLHSTWSIASKVRVRKTLKLSRRRLELN